MELLEERPVAPFTMAEGDTLTVLWNNEPIIAYNRLGKREINCVRIYSAAEFEGMTGAIIVVMGWKEA